MFFLFCYFPLQTKVQLEDAEEAKIKRLFTAYDRDHNGFVH